MPKHSISPWPSFTQQESDAVSRVLLSNAVNFWTGQECRKFESEFAEWVEAKYAITLSNGTVALEAALHAFDIGAGDEVVVTPRSFIASASCVVRQGGRPVFADVDPESQNITAETVEAVLTENTKAIIAVHHAGWPCDMDPLMRLAEERNLVVIEDCAQAHGARYKGRSVGSIGHAGAFSFCQDKIMTTAGEGGMLVTNSESAWQRAWSMKDHGKSYDAVFNQDHPPGFRWLHESFGTNWRMTEMQAAVGRIQLTRMTDWRERRRKNAARIAETLKRHPAISVPNPPDDICHAFYRLYALVDASCLDGGWDRDRIIMALGEIGIPGFSGSCPEMYNEKAFDAGDLRPAIPLPVAARLGDQSLAFLVHPTLTEEDLDFVCRGIDDVMSRAAVNSAA